MIRAIATGTLAVLLLAGCTPVVTPSPSPTGISPTSEPTPTAAPDPTPSESYVAVDPSSYPYPDWATGVAFSSPSGNIHCGYEQSTAPRAYEIGGCAAEVAEFTFPELAPGEEAACTSSNSQTWGGGFTLFDGVVAVQCRNGGGLFWPGELEGYESPVLPYGHSITFGDMICESSEDGMTCRSLTSGHGFRLSRSDYELF